MIIALGKPQAVVPEETTMDMEDNQDETKLSPRIKRMESNNNSIPRALLAKDGNNTSKLPRNTISVFGKISIEFRIYITLSRVSKMTMLTFQKK